MFPVWVDNSSVRLLLPWGNWESCLKAMGNIDSFLSRWRVILFRKHLLVFSSNLRFLVAHIRAPVPLRLLHSMLPCYRAQFGPGKRRWGHGEKISSWESMHTDLILVREMFFSLLQRYGEDGSWSPLGPLQECGLVAG